MEYFVAEFTSDFNQHADILKFFRSLDVSNSYFVRSVAFGSELIRLQNIEKQFSSRPSTLSVACGLDEEMPRAPIKQVRALTVPLTLSTPPSFYMDTKPMLYGHSNLPTRAFDVSSITLDSDGEEAMDETSLTPAPTNTTATHSETNSHVSRDRTDDWRWMCHDLSSDSDSDDDCVEAKPLVAKEELVESAASPVEKEQRDYVECGVCEARQSLSTKNLRFRIFNHALSHLDANVYGDRFYCYKCSFSSMTYDPIQIHSKKSRHGFADRTKETVAPDFIRECASLFSKCYPTQCMPDRFSRTLEAVERSAGRHVEEEIGKDKDKCQKCLKVMNTKHLLYHALTHIDASLFGHPFKCDDCKVAHNSYKTVRIHAMNERHTYTARYAESSEPEMVVECVRLFRECFPRGEMPKRLQQALTDVDKEDRVDTTSVALQAKTPTLIYWLNKDSKDCSSDKTPVSKKRPLASPQTGPSVKRATDTAHTCKMCSVTMHPTNPTLAKWQLMGHALSHMDVGEYGRRFKCTGCGYMSNKNAGHFNQTDHVVCDRAQSIDHSEFVVECVRLATACFPDNLLPVGVRTTYEQVNQQSASQAPSKTPQKTDGEIVPCQQCPREIQCDKNTNWRLLAHSVNHIDIASFGKRFVCRDCGHTQSTSSTYHFKDGHVRRDRAQDPSQIEYIRECTRHFALSFPGYDLPRAVAAIMNGTRVEKEKVEMVEEEQRQEKEKVVEEELEREREQENPRRRDSVDLVDGLDYSLNATASEGGSTCQICSLTLVTSKSWHLFSHAVLHIDASEYGERYKCGGCGEVSRNGTKTPHFNRKNHICIDRAKNAEEREFVLECGRVYAACFPDSRLPPAIQTTYETVTGEKEQEQKEEMEYQEEENREKMEQEEEEKKMEQEDEEEEIEQEKEQDTIKEERLEEHSMKRVQTCVMDTSVASISHDDAM